MNRKMMIIAPAFGEALLASYPYNRPLSTKNVKDLAKLFEKNGWVDGAPPLVVDCGVLKCGKHRLTALKLLGWPPIAVEVVFYGPGEYDERLTIISNCCKKQTSFETVQMLLKRKINKAYYDIVQACFAAVSGTDESIEEAYAAIDDRTAAVIESYFVSDNRKGNACALSAGFVLCDLAHDGAERERMVEFKEAARKGLTTNPVVKKIEKYMRDELMNDATNLRPLRVFYAAELLFQGKRKCPTSLRGVRTDDLCSLVDQYREKIRSAMGLEGGER